MRLVEVVSALRLNDDDQQTLSQEWDDSQARWPGDEPFFLQPAYIAQACRSAALPEEAVRRSVAAAKIVAEEPALSALIWHFAHCLGSKEYPRSAIAKWPSLDHVAFDVQSEQLYLLAVLAALDRARDLYGQRLIPEDVVLATWADVGRWAAVYHERHGTWGLTLGNLNWLTNHLRCEIFQLGRLQFQLNSFRCQVRAFRHRASGAVLALSEDGLSYRSDGQRNGAGGVTESVGVWESKLELTDEAVLGNPILPVGQAIAELYRLSRDEWEQILAPGDPVLQIHIPAGSRLDFEQCGDSFQRSLVFFPRYFPEFEFVAWAGSSWLLDPQLEKLLGPEANLVRFLSEFYLLPIKSDGRDVLRRVFGEIPDDLARAPRDTTLRRALIDHLSAGGHWHDAAGFIMRQDLDWGKQFYRNQALPQFDKQG